MTHSTTACHIFGWQPGSSLSRNIKFCYLAILFGAIPRSLGGPNQCPLFSSFWNRLQRHEWRMEARVLAEAKKADVLQRPFPVGTGLEEVFTQPGEWKDWGLLPGPSGKQGTPWLGARVNLDANTPSAAGRGGLSQHPGYFGNYSRRDAPARRCLSAVSQGWLKRTHRDKWFCLLSEDYCSHLISSHVPTQAYKRSGPVLCAHVPSLGFIIWVLTGSHSVFVHTDVWINSCFCISDTFPSVSSPSLKQHYVTFCPKITASASFTWLIELQYECRLVSARCNISGSTKLHISIELCFKMLFSSNKVHTTTIWTHFCS